MLQEQKTTVLNAVDFGVYISQYIIILARREGEINPPKI